MHLPYFIKFRCLFKRHLNGNVLIFCNVSEVRFVIRVLYSYIDVINVLGIVRFYQHKNSTKYFILNPFCLFQVINFLSNVDNTRESIQNNAHGDNRVRDIASDKNVVVDLSQNTLTCENVESHHPGNNTNDGNTTEKNKEVGITNNAKSGEDKLQLDTSSLSTERAATKPFDKSTFAAFDNFLRLPRPDNDYINWLAGRNVLNVTLKSAIFSRGYLSVWVKINYEIYTDISENDWIDQIEHYA